MKLTKKHILLALVIILSIPVSFAQFTLQDKIVADAVDREVMDSYGTVSIHGDYAVVGSRNDDDQGIDAGAAYLYKWNGVTCQWEQIDKFYAESTIGVPDPTDYGRFGNDVSLSGNLIAIGAWKYDHSGYNEAGAVYIYQIISGTVIFVQKILPYNNTLALDAGPTNYFGISVKLHRNQLIIGSYDDTDADGLNFIGSAGSSYIYKIGTYPFFNFETKLSAPFRASSDLFGHDVSIYGRYAIVGAPNEDEDATESNTMSQSGSAYIYEYNLGVWSLKEKIVAGDRDADDRFGWTVDISSQNIIVAAIGDEHDETGGGTPLMNAGSAYFWRRLGINWFLDQKVVANVREANDWFGWSAALFNDKAAIGSPFEDHDASNANFVNAAGSAYVFDRAVTWTQSQKIVAPNRGGFDFFGQNIALSYNHIIVGAVSEDHDDIFPYTGGFLMNAGSAYVYNVNNLPTIPILSSSSTNICSGSLVTLSISSGSLNDASDWQWYEGSCGGTSIGSGVSITVNPITTTTYYVRGEGCFAPGACASITITVGAGSGGTWHQTTKNANGGDVTNDAITDLAGNVYVTGTFRTKTSLFGGTNPDMLMNAFVNQSASYVAKYNPCGDLQWESHAVYSKNNRGRSIVLDQINGIVYITGDFKNNLTFVSSGTCTSTPTSITSGGTIKGYVAGFKMNGGCGISLDVVTQNTYTSCEAIAIDETTSNIFVGGISSAQNSGTPHTSFVHKYNPSLTTIGAIQSTVTSYSGNYLNRINDMDYDELNEKLYIIGDFEQKVKFYPGSGVLYVSNSNSVSQDAFLLCYQDTPGAFVPVIQVRGNTNSFMSGEGISIDPFTGNPYFTGTYRSFIDLPFETSVIDNLPAFSSMASYMIGYDILGGTGWSRYGHVALGEADGKSVVVKDDHVHFTGNFTRSDLDIENVGGFPYVTLGTASSMNHVYAASYKLNGIGVWGNVTTDPSSNSGLHHAESITADNAGHLFIVGKYRKSMDYFLTNVAPALVSTGIGTNGFILRADYTTGALFTINNDKPTGVNNNNTVTIAGKVVPNPTSGIGQYIIEDYDSEKIYTLIIVNALGQTIVKTTVIDGRFRFDLTSQRNGIYFISLTDGITTTFDKLIKAD